ncbi:AsmA family protein [Flavobacterium magnum]|uniref:AsmA family protein n=1 Tax=Flavobacterium magnum TaxID=2162713 RepID=A0A2S0RDX0_9FLAO|nr:AsmA-like C-terminal region-containing protein [Flavobacterium magnum]AWA28902.1 AsmA family protein [Flavobacterium magnum]
MLKKILKIAGIVLLLLIAALFAIPYLFEDQIKAKIAEAINKKVDAKVSFADADLSLFRNFPEATVSVDKLLIINKAPFEGDTLVSMGTLNFEMSIKELFKGKDEPMNIEAISSENAVVNILFNKDGVGNFDIAFKDEKEQDNAKGDPISLKIKQYEVKNLRFTYFDERSKIKMVIDSLDHKGTGDFTNDKLDLTTTSKARVSLDMDKVNYMKNVALSLDAVLGIDMAQNKYTFKNNKALINKLPLEFDGFLRLADEGQEYDLTFRTPTSDFQNFLGLIPSAYSGSLENVKTTGNFSVKGFAKGMLTDTTVPKFSIEMASNDASFQYPNLPKSVQDIVVDMKVVNDSGIMNDTYVNLDKLAFRIDQDVFDAHANIKNVTVNPMVDAALKGTVNLANLSKAYPIKLDKPLSGILKADVKTRFDMKSVETSQYQNIRNEGTVSLSGFRYTDEKGKALDISQAVVAFNPSRVNLQQFNAKTGKTDLSVNGTLDNFYGYMFKNQELKGNFNLTSNQFAVSDFMTTEAPNTKTTAPAQEAIKIPAFLNCTLSAKMNTVLYDNLVLRDMTGKVIIKDQKVTLENLKTNIFGGMIALNGDVSTKGKVPVFNMNLGLNKVDIQQTFTQLDMMKSIAPIAGVINGKLNSTIKLSGKLDAKEMTPDLKSLSGDLFGQFLSTTVNAGNSELLNTLSNNVKFIDLKKINFNDLKANLTFNDGKVSLKPITLKYQDIKINLQGQHGFDQSLVYNVGFDVPAKYLGTEVNKLLAQLSPADAAKVDNIPVKANITGTFKNPKVTTDMKQAVTNLASQLVKQQKDKLINQGTKALGNLIGGKKDSTKTTPSTKEEVKTEVKTKAKDLLNGLFNKNKKTDEKK